VHEARLHISETTLVLDPPDSVIDHRFTRMAIFPQWNCLKHFNSVVTTKFTDGNAFYDILKVRGTIFEPISMSSMLIIL
jgi:hypothetical protein